jgi:hypothetical protein|tara:strand:- start:61385 stop:61582 length:198 start_codon:yes stop_codon:yes gene_type:complete
MTPTTINPAQRGYGITYHLHATNYCPGCGHAHWYIGRATAECAFCNTVLPLGTTESRDRNYVLAS